MEVIEGFINIHLSTLHFLFHTSPTDVAHAEVNLSESIPIAVHPWHHWVFLRCPNITEQQLLSLLHHIHYSSGVLFHLLFIGHGVCCAKSILLWPCCNILTVVLPYTIQQIKLDLTRNSKQLLVLAMVISHLNCCSGLLAALPWNTRRCSRKNTAHLVSDQPTGFPRSSEIKSDKTRDFWICTYLLELNYTGLLSLSATVLLQGTSCGSVFPTLKPVSSSVAPLVERATTIYQSRASLPIFKKSLEDPSLLRAFHLLTPLIFGLTVH